MVGASVVTVLSYHRIEEPGNPDLAESLVDAFPRDFEEQMRYVARRYSVIPARDLVRSLTEDYTLPPNSLVITFDDGYRSFMDEAFTVLKRLGLPATMFVATNKVSNPNDGYWWDTLYRAFTHTALNEIEVSSMGVLQLGTMHQRCMAFYGAVGQLERMDSLSARRVFNNLVETCGVEPSRERSILNWDEVRALEAEGISFGPHSRNHLILAQAGADQIEAEVGGSWTDLQEQVAHPLPIFCYPNGRAHAVNADVVAAVKRAGLVGAFTTDPGLNAIGRTDPYKLYRVGSSAGETMRHFAIKLTAAGRLYRRVKSVVRHSIGETSIGPVPRSVGETPTGAHAAHA